MIAASAEPVHAAEVLEVLPRSQSRIERDLLRHDSDSPLRFERIVHERDAVHRPNRRGVPRSGAARHEHLDEIADLNRALHGEPLPQPIALCPTRIAWERAGTETASPYTPRARAGTFEAMNLYGRTIDALSRLVLSEGLPAYRARQIAEWLYRHHAESVASMTNLPAPLRDAWSNEHEVRAPLPTTAGVSSDGTKKYTWQASDGDVFESALIPDRDRLTLCVSSQAGCRIGCKFCLTARKGLRQNLSAAEILGQYRNLPERDLVTHFVFMGMGEPLDNTAEVLSTLEVLTADWGYGFSPRRITVSTVGILPDLERLIDSTDANIAISMHAAKREDRLPLVPSENRHPIATIVELLRHRAQLALPPFTGTGRRRLSFEITMIDGVTDSPAQAESVRELIRGVPSRVNLIPWNPFPGARFRPSTRPAIERFQSVLKRSGVTTTIRESRGQDIGAACGLLAGRNEAVRTGR